MRKYIPFGLALPLILSACGSTSAPTQPSSSIKTKTSNLKTFGQLINEPGWRQVSSGVWNKSDNGIENWIYSGLQGAKYLRGCLKPVSPTLYVPHHPQAHNLRSSIQLLAA